MTIWVETCRLVSSAQPNTITCSYIPLRLLEVMTQIFSHVMKRWRVCIIPGHAFYGVKTVNLLKIRKIIASLDLINLGASGKAMFTGSIIQEIGNGVALLIKLKADLSVFVCKAGLAKIFSWICHTHLKEETTDSWPTIWPNVFRPTLFNLA